MTLYREFADDADLRSQYVYEAPMRVWHWLNALLVVVLTGTGYYIGTPLPSYTGDPSTVYVMGVIRFAHLAAAWLFTACWVLRLWWAVVGNAYARQVFLPTFWSRRWVAGLRYQIAWNLLLVRRARRYQGLNPLTQLMMLALFVVPSLVLILTGFAMYAEVSGHAGVIYTLFGWMTAITANTMDLHTIHRLAMWGVLVFMVCHIYAAVRDDITTRQTVVTTMLSGFRLFQNGDHR